MDRDCNCGCINYIYSWFPATSRIRLKLKLLLQFKAWIFMINFQNDLEISSMFVFYNSLIFVYISLVFVASDLALSYCCCCCCLPFLLSDVFLGLQSQSTVHDDTEKYVGPIFILNFLLCLLSISFFRIVYWLISLLLVHRELYSQLIARRRLGDIN